MGHESYYTLCKIPDLLPSEALSPADEYWTKHFLNQAWQTFRTHKLKQNENTVILAMSLWVEEFGMRLTEFWSKTTGQMRHL